MRSSCLPCPFGTASPKKTHETTEGEACARGTGGFQTGTLLDHRCAYKDRSQLDEAGEQQPSICLSAVLSVMETFSLSLGTVRKPKYVMPGRSVPLSGITFRSFPTHWAAAPQITRRIHSPAEPALPPTAFLQSPSLLPVPPWGPFAP